MGTFAFEGSTASFSFAADEEVSYKVLFNPDLKALLREYAELSSKPELPPDSGYGPVFWSDNILRDFHGSVENAEENLYDVVDHLYYNEIRATAMFADSKWWCHSRAWNDLETALTEDIGPYGTGNMSFGNFDFDPEFFPDPEAFIANITEWGYDFQVRSSVEL